MFQVMKHACRLQQNVGMHVFYIVFTETTKNVWIVVRRYILFGILVCIAQYNE